MWEDAGYCPICFAYTGRMKRATTGDGGHMDSSFHKKALADWEETRRPIDVSKEARTINWDEKMRHMITWGTPPAGPAAEPLHALEYGGLQFPPPWTAEQVPSSRHQSCRKTKKSKKYMPGKRQKSSPTSFYRLCGNLASLTNIYSGYFPVLNKSVEISGVSMPGRYQSGPNL